MKRCGRLEVIAADMLRSYPATKACNGEIKEHDIATEMRLDTRFVPQAFEQERHIQSRQTFKDHWSSTLSEWRQIAAWAWRNIVLKIRFFYSDKAQLRY